KVLDKVRRFLDELGRRELVRARDHDGLEAELVTLARAREWGWRLGGAKGSLRAEVAARREAARAALDAAISAANADLAACLHAELGPLVEQYDVQKSRAGKLDFLDL